MHDGCPQLELDARWQPPQHAEPAAAGIDWGVEKPESLLADIVVGLNLCSKEQKARQYDHEVKGLSVVKPFVGVAADVPAEATVTLARHGSLRGFVLSEGIHPYLSDIDTHAMASTVVDEAVRRQVSAGARPDRIALLAVWRKRGCEATLLGAVLAFQTGIDPAGHHVEHTRGDDARDELGDTQCREGGLRGGLHHHGVARGQRRGQLGGAALELNQAIEYLAINDVEMDLLFDQ